LRQKYNNNQKSSEKLSGSTASWGLHLSSPALLFYEFASWCAVPLNIDIVVLTGCSEVSDLDTGLLLEVWEKGLLWDRAIGYHWCPLTTVPYSQQVALVVAGGVGC
jgi:hypothetical protein